MPYNLLALKFAMIVEVIFHVQLVAILMFNEVIKVSDRKFNSNLSSSL